MFCSFEECDPRFVNRHGQNLVQVAAGCGKVDVLKWLVEYLTKGEDEAAELLNTQDYHGDTPLVWSSRQGYASVVRYVTKFPKVDIFSVNKTGSNAMHMSSSRGHVDVMDALLASCNGDKESCS